MKPLEQDILAETVASLASRFILWAGGKAQPMLRRLTRQTQEEYRAIEEPRERHLWDERLNTVLQEIGDGIADADAVETESFEPAAQRFTHDALRSAIESPSEEKRRVLGRLIIRRMESRTESFYELQLREAQAIARDSSPDQIACLATVMLLLHTPLPQQEELHAPWFGECLDAAFTALESATWTESDLDHLIREGALWRVEGTDGSRAFMATHHFRGPQRERASALAGTRRMTPNAVTGTVECENQRPNLSAYWLSSAGAVLAAAVLERIIGRRVYFPEWEERKNTAASDLIAPFDSAYLAECEAQRRNAYDARMKNIVKRDQEDQLRRMRSSRYLL